MHVAFYINNEPVVLLSQKFAILLWSTLGNYLTSAQASEDDIISIFHVKLSFLALSGSQRLARLELGKFFQDKKPKLKTLIALMQNVLDDNIMLEEATIVEFLIQELRKYHDFK